MRRNRFTIPALAAAVVLSGGGLIVAGLDGSSPLAVGPSAGFSSAAPGLPPSPGDPRLPPSPAGPSPEELAAAERAKRVKRLDAALKKLDAASPEFSVAVLDKTTGETYAYRGKEKYDTASVVKADILACMLLRAQDAGRKPTSGEMALAKPMIRLSDNNATTALFERLGGRSAVSRCNSRLGLTGTVVSSRWGLTRTTVSDQVRLLAEMTDKSGPLDAGSRRTAFTLMNTVAKTQDWGVPAIAEPGETATVKNGWDTRSADGGLWAVNTVGRVTSSDGAVDVSVAVLSHDNRSQASGIKLVEKVAKLTRQHLKY